MAQQITPEYLAKSGTEDAHQMALMCWTWFVREQHPELVWLYHVPNGGVRDKITAGKMKQMGVKRGVPDLFLPLARGDWHGLYIEMKKPSLRPVRERKPDTKPAGCSEEQWTFGQFARSQNYGWIVCYSWEEARDAILSYLNWE